MTERKRKHRSDPARRGFPSPICGAAEREKRWRNRKRPVQFPASRRAARASSWPATFRAALVATSSAPATEQLINTTLGLLGAQGRHQAGSRRYRSAVLSGKQRRLSSRYTSTAGRRDIREPMPHLFAQPTRTAMNEQERRMPSHDRLIGRQARSNRTRGT